MSCEICADERGGAGRCPRCGYPEVGAEGAHALHEAAGALAAASGNTEALNRVIRKIQQAVRAAPKSYLPRLRLAAAYERKAQEGESSLLRLAERELAEALRLGPDEVEVHAARLSVAGRLGNLSALKAEYEARRDDLSIAEDCLRMIGAMEQATSLRKDLKAANPGQKERARWYLPVALALAGAGVLELVVVLRASMREASYSALGDQNLYLAAGLFTATSVLLLEWFRAGKASGS